MIFAVLGFMWLPKAWCAEKAKEPAAVVFFRDQVRPLLVSQCLGCHGPDKKKADLDLSRRETLLQGGENGPAVVPGKPQNSLLFKKVSAGKMPPTKPLSPEQIATIKQWIAEGAVFDRQPLVKVTKGEIPWSFRPISRPAVPQSRFDQLSQNPIDLFLFAKLAEKDLAPSPPADKLALLRRVTVDLTGLLPTPAEVDAFLKDASPEAYHKVVDRLLAAPAYGERWARHWLDVVRFGESHGYEQNHLRPNAWPYRDYVIRAFNNDKPFDRFVAEQLAGDVLARGDPAVEVATGFLVAGMFDTVLGRTIELFRQQRANDLDDMVSTVGAAFLGLTVGCAKCHDHKFDPIPQKDYYRLAAVFAGVRHGERVPAGKETGWAQRHGQRLRQVVRELADLEAKARLVVLREQGLDPVPRPAVSPRYNGDDFPTVTARFVRFTILATNDGLEPCLDELEIFGPDSTVNLARAKGAKASASSLLPGYAIHQIHHLTDGRYGNSWSWISKQRGGGWAQIELPAAAKIARVAWSRDAGEFPKFNDRLPSAYQIEVSGDGKNWRTVATGADRALAPEAIPPRALARALTADQEKKRQGLLAEAKELLTNAIDEGSRIRAYIGQFAVPHPIPLLKRGDVMQPGEVVPPGALAHIPGLSADLKLPDNAVEPARRLALARWLTDPKNPLTARVIVNRVWQYHFGRGLAATSSDFGNNGSRPTHPELLDWLTRDFLDHGWRLKRLQKQIVTSYAYRQSSAAGALALAKDAGNLYLGRMPLKRMEGEALRDAILQVSGKLDRTVGGPSFALFKYRVVNVAIYEPLEEFSPATWRRGIYAYSARAIRDDLLGSFDCPECAQRTPRRDITTTPLQALSLLNGPFAVQQAEFFAQRIQKEVKDTPGTQVIYAFRLAFGRSPTRPELQASLELISRRGLTALCRALLNANEFLYY